MSSQGSSGSTEREEVFSMESRRKDPLTLPPELSQMILDLLPIIDTWRLRSVSRLWNDHLRSSQTLSAMARRWNTHEPEQRASLGTHPRPTLEEDAQRIENWLSGNPCAYAHIPFYLTENNDPHYEFPVLQGKWLAWDLPSFADRPAIDLCDLLSGTCRSSDLPEHPRCMITRGPVFTTTTLGLVIIASNDPAGHGHEIILHTISLQDFSSKTLRCSSPASAFQGRHWLATNGQYIGIFREEWWEVEHHNIHVLIYDPVQDRTFSLSYTIPVQLETDSALAEPLWTCAYRDMSGSESTINANDMTVTIYTQFERHRSDIHPAADDAELSVHTTVSREYTFEGQLLRESHRDI